MSVWCGTWSDMSDMSDKSDFIGVPQVQKTEGQQNIGFCNSSFFSCNKRLIDGAAFDPGRNGTEDVPGVSSFVIAPVGDVDGVPLH